MSSPYLTLILPQTTNHHDTTALLSALQSDHFFDDFFAPVNKAKPQPTKLQMTFNRVPISRSHRSPNVSVTLPLIQEYKNAAMNIHAAYTKYMDILCVQNIGTDEFRAGQYARCTAIQGLLQKLKDRFEDLHRLALEWTPNREGLPDVFREAVEAALEWLERLWGDMLECHMYLKREHGHRMDLNPLSITK